MKTILFQGDSITDCGRVRHEPKSAEKLLLKLKGKSSLGSGYPFLIAKELEGEYCFVNKGVSGDRILDVYARIVRDIIKVKPDVMSLLVGVNDVWHGLDWNNGTGKERFKKVFTMLIQELTHELPQMKIIILEPFILEGTATKNRKDQPHRYYIFKKELEEIAAIEKEIALEYGASFVELQKHFDAAAFKTQSACLLSDGVHPTLKGHEIIKREWLKAFREL